MTKQTHDGLILKGVGGFYEVLHEGRRFTCRARGRFRLDGIKPLPGDHVTISVWPDGAARLEEIHPRRNHWIRPPVVNLDGLALVACAARPATDVFLLDRLTVAAAEKGLSVWIVINKTDLDPGDSLYDTYTRADYPCLRVSAETGEGVEDLRAALSGRVVAFAGHSGVGKSSLLNRLAPELDLPVGSVSEKSGRGRHTTRHVELYPLSGDVFLVDTPGFSAFALEETDVLVPPEDLWSLFPESRLALEPCRFLDCRHVGEDGCGVCAAVEDGRIARTRHESYVKLLRQCQSHKSWEHGATQTQ